MKRVVAITSLALAVSLLLMCADKVHVSAQGVALTGENSVTKFDEYGSIGVFDRCNLRNLRMTVRSVFASSSPECQPGPQRGQDHHQNESCQPKNSIYELNSSPFQVMYFVE
jgi:hypothetical protein